MSVHQRHVWHALTLLLLLGSLLAPLSASAQATATEAARPPVLAYYYIWYTPSSWQRAKLDLPLLGPYSSDDPDVMRQQVQWAKAAGIDGFIVSWKHTDSLSKRLAQLVDIARQENFKLVINYEGLDFYRHPLPVDRIDSDLTYFTKTYRDDAVFDIFGKPTIIWAGTWKFNRTQIGEVTKKHRQDLNILASAKQPDSYSKIGDLVDGNAYYWSSVDPMTFQDYAGKLDRMSQAVHDHHGIWIAPAAPGFDARHLGGERAVPRRDGQTLEAEYHVALSSRPDAVGLISWNEFSENSHVEPSCHYGDASLKVVAGLLGGQVPEINVPCDTAALATAEAGARSATPEVQATPVVGLAPIAPFDWDSSAPQGTADRNSRIGTLALIGIFTGIMGFSVTRITRRALQEGKATQDESSRVHLVPPGGGQS